MSAATLAYVMAALQALPYLISAGANLATEVASIITFMEAGKDPTPEQWQAQNVVLLGALNGLMTAKPQS